MSKTVFVLSVENRTMCIAKSLLSCYGAIEGAIRERMRLSEFDEIDICSYSSIYRAVTEKGIYEDRLPINGNPKLTAHIKIETAKTDI